MLRPSMFSQRPAQLVNDERNKRYTVQYQKHYLVKKRIWEESQA